MTTNEIVVLKGLGTKRLNRRNFSTYTVQNETPRYSSKTGANSASFRGVLDTCQCSGCPLHTRNTCRRDRPLNRLDGEVLCSSCLNRRLELQRRRLYPEIIPDVT